MPQITIRVSDEIYMKLIAAAEEKNLTLTDFLLSNSIPDYLKDSLTVDKVIDRLPSVKAGELFTIPDLFSYDEWNKFTSGSRISTGRLFRQALDKDKFDLKKRVAFIKKNSANLAIYKKLTDD